MSSRQVAVHQINEMTGPNFACMNGLQLGAVCRGISGSSPNRDDRNDLVRTNRFAEHSTT